jgi:hypothetical protein
MKRKFVYLGLTILLFLAMNAGCGNQTAQVQQNNSNPVGSITGEIFDQNTNAPLLNAKAYVLVNGNYQVATSNAQGAYTLSNLPLGAVYTVTYTAPGYATPIYNVDLNVNASQFPQGNAVVQQNVGMFQLGASVSGTVTNGITGGCPSSTGLQGATVVFDLRNIGNGTPFVGFDLMPNTTTDASGNYTISGLPASIFGTFPDQANPLRVCAYIVANNQYYIRCANVGGLYPNATTSGIDICMH